MPILHLSIDRELHGRLREGARARAARMDDYAIETLRRGLESRDARSRGGSVSAQRLTPEQRSARARKAAQARHAKPV